MDRPSKTVINLIGNTPCVHLKSFSPEGSQIWAKLEMQNPGGSVKDRPVLAMMAEAERTGKLKTDSLIVEPTSGNTGIAIAMISAAKGYSCALVMPETMSIERRKIMRAFGADIILSPGDQGMAGAIIAVEKILKEDKKAITLGQFENPANPQSHYLATGPEIIAQMNGRIDAFVAGIGTGGTITGVARAFLKSQIPVRIYGVEPEESAVLSGRPKGKHAIEGIGAGFIPKILERKLIDEIIRVDTQTAKEYTRALAKDEGIFAGVSSGAALAATAYVAERLGKGKRIVTIFPDAGYKYLSTELFE
ncbi:MAG TPA: cysteine synthase A [candidate division Zixibacteria bacterium]|nr:cysteine synthase A [candidate division Zixibacteria bacterium]